VYLASESLILQTAFAKSTEVKATKHSVCLASPSFGFSNEGVKVSFLSYPLEKLCCDASGEKLVIAVDIQSKLR
jgi:hypothetical protein